MRDAPAVDPDLELVQRAGRGEGAACAALVDRHLTRVHAVALRILGNRADAEEVAQDVFLRVWRHAAEWRPGPALFSTWLHRVAVNLCRDRLRRRRETDLEAAGDPPSDDPAPDAGLQSQAVSSRVAAAMAVLPERQRMAITLCYYQEMSNIEAASVMELSVEAVESLLARGRRRLGELLVNDAPDLLGDLQ